MALEVRPVRPSVAFEVDDFSRPPDDEVDADILLMQRPLSSGHASSEKTVHHFRKSLISFRIMTAHRTAPPWWAVLRFGH